jgi:tape measure domain-containing protein
MGRIEAFRLVGRIQVEGKEETKRALREVEAETEKTAEGFKGMSKAASLAAGFVGGLAARYGGDLVGGLKQGIVALVETSARLEQAQIGFATLLGSAEQAQQHLAELQRFAAKTPFEFEDVVRASRRFQNMGIEASETIPLLTAVGNAVAAAGGGSQEIDRVTTALAQMGAKGKVSAEELNQLAEAGVGGQRILAEYMGKTTGEVLKLASQGRISADTFFAAFKQFSDLHYGDAMEQQSRTFNGALSTIKDNLLLLGTKAINPTFQQIRNLTVALNESEGVWGRALDVAPYAARFITEMSPVLALLERLDNLRARLAGPAAGRNVELMTPEELAKLGMINPDYLKSRQKPPSLLDHPYVITPEAEAQLREQEAFARRMEDLNKFIDEQVKEFFKGQEVKAATAEASKLVEGLRSKLNTLDDATGVKAVNEQFGRMREAIRQIKDEDVQTAALERLVALQVEAVKITEAAYKRAQALEAEKKTRDEARQKLDAYVRSTHDLEDALKHFGDTTRATADWLRIQRGEFGQLNQEQIAYRLGLARRYDALGRVKAVQDSLNDALADEKTHLGEVNDLLKDRVAAAQLTKYEKQMWLIQGYAADLKKHLQEAFELQPPQFVTGEIPIPNAARQPDGSYLPIITGADIPPPKLDAWHAYFHEHLDDIAGDMTRTFSDALRAVGRGDGLKGFLDALYHGFAVTVQRIVDDLIYGLLRGALSGLLSPSGPAGAKKSGGLFGKILGIGASLLGGFIPGGSVVTGLLGGVLGGGAKAAAGAVPAAGGATFFGRAVGQGGFTSFIPGRASGGPVSRGRAYLVGEHRAEVFTPDQDGWIHPSAAAYGRGSGGDGHWRALVARLEGVIERQTAASERHAAALEKFEGMPAGHVLVKGAQTSDGRAAIMKAWKEKMALNQGDIEWMQRRTFGQ